MNSPTKKKALVGAASTLILGAAVLAVVFWPRPDPSPPETDLIVSDPIAITSNRGFIDLQCAGNGTDANPYVLENLAIEARGSTATGISIRSTTAHFIIRNCRITSDYIGIHVHQAGAETGTILNNSLASLSGDGGGILVTSTSNCTILNNTATNFAQGIHLNEASHCLIKGNTVYNNTAQGINIRRSSNNIAVGNRISNHTQHGLALVGTANNNLVYGNLFLNNGRDANYTIDGERTGPMASQAYDEGSGNLWYLASAAQGNIWGDFQGAGPYAIDGPSGAADSFPGSPGSSSAPSVSSALSIPSVPSSP